MADDAVFLDTSVIVAASVAAHPAHSSALRYVQAASQSGRVLCISPQVCREFMVVLTRQPVADRMFSVEEALGALEKWRVAATLLEETVTSVAEWQALVRKHDVRGKQVHDCNIVAVMVAHGVK